MTKNTGTTRPNCYKCVHFYVTWDPAHPYGCRGMGFKTKISPALAVFRNSGMECQLFELKAATSATNLSTSESNK